MVNIFSKQYLFSSPTTVIPYITQLTIFLIWLMLIGIILLFFSFNKNNIPPLRRLFKGISYSFIVSALLGVVFVLARINRLSIINYRVWYIFWLLLIACLIIWNWWKYRRVYPQDKKRYYEEITKLKYLPKKKKSRRDK